MVTVLGEGAAETSGWRTSRWAAALGLALFVSFGACLYALMPLAGGVALVIIFGWMALPGVIITRRLFASQRGQWLPALLAGPSLGFSLSSLVLLGLWVSGVRHPALLGLAPLGALALAPACRRLRPLLDAPAFDRRDVVPILIVLSLVPIVDGRPYARVGELRPEGKAYRAYFIADFEWAMAVAAEVSKGDVPPRNPFLAGDSMHYYWLADLLSAAEHRATQRTLPIESVLLCNALCLDLAFVGFLYFFVRNFVRSPSAAAIACLAAVLCSSFEGAQQVYVFWQRGIPFDGLRNLNIDAISNWRFGSLKVDGLQRVLLYQPQHATAWAVSLSALLVVCRARDNGRAAVNALAGALLAVSLLVSSFIAVMVGCVVAAYQLVTLAARRQWKGLVLGAVAGGLPVALALVVSAALNYVDHSGGPIVVVGRLNPLAATNTVTGIALSFGPMLIAAAMGAWLAVRRQAREYAVLALVIATAFGFYFFVDVVDHQHAYVGWRAGHLLFMAFAPLAGFAWQELWAAGGRTRGALTGGAVLLALAAAPTTVIDLYNSQDTANQRQGPGFRWTEIVTPGELEALDWIKTHTPPDALVQVDPVRESGTWAYMPAFGARRMAAGMPLSMIPLKKYQEASQRVREVFTARDAAAAHGRASELGIDYLYVGPAERRSYPDMAGLLDAAPLWFPPVFRNGVVSIYGVTPAPR
jgi:hypothetical protein